MIFSSKRWCLLFGCMCVLSVTAIILVNFLMDSDGYFSSLPYDQSGFSYFSPRNAKIRYIRENRDLYNGFIVGGSRTGVTDPEMVSKYTGLSFYNIAFPYGLQNDYEYIIDFLIAHTQVKHIILQMNGEELSNAEAQNTIQNMFIVDSKISSKLKELKQELLADCAFPLIKFTLRIPSFDAKIKENGMVEYIEQYSPAEREDLIFVDKYIVPGFKTDYKNIFMEKTLYDYKNLEYVYNSLERIQRKCLMNDIRLTIILAPSSISALANVESPLYWEYLRNIAAIHEFYNFNGYAHFNFNPYNFVDNGHYRKEVADKMLRIIFEQEESEDTDWGLLLSPNTIDAYIERRKESYYRLKHAYEETRNIPLGTMYDSSFIPLTP